MISMCMHLHMHGYAYICIYICMHITLTEHMGTLLFKRGLPGAAFPTPHRLTTKTRRPHPHPLPHPCRARGTRPLPARPRTGC